MKSHIIDANKIDFKLQLLAGADGEIYVDVEEVKKAIAQTPSAAVTCEECENYKPVSDKCGNCHNTTIIMHPTDFCSRGKKKEKSYE